MSTPGSGGFEYTDDSVIAKVSFDIPSSAVSDINQITQVMSAMRTELESIARAQSNWIDYLNQVPQIASQANQAYREQITLMERMSYLHNEIGTTGYGQATGDGQPVGGGGYGPAGGMAGGGGAGYSTAAPPGHTDPFKGMVEGTGKGINPNAAINAAAQAMDDPRAAVENMAARGMAINPALLGTAAAAAAGILGHGKGGDRPGSTSRQKGQESREAANPPVADNGGSPDGAEDQNAPNSGAPKESMRNRILMRTAKEAAVLGKGTRYEKILGQAPDLMRSALDTFGGGGGDGGGGDGTGAGDGSAGGSSGGGRFGPLGSAVKGAMGSALKSREAKIAAGVGLGALAFNRTQSIGERITRLQALGSEEGGDWTTGLKEDLHARMIGLDPFISSDQARKAIAMPMSAGFQGESRDQLRDLLINNFKELGMTMADSMKMSMASLKGVDLSDENVLKSRTADEGLVNVLKEMSGDGGNTMALNERVQQATKIKETLASMGVGQESANRSAIGFQQGYDDSLALRGSMARIGGQTMGSNTLMAMVGQKVGLTGVMPGAMPAALAEMGIDSDQAMEMAATEAAKYVSGLQPEYNRIAAFMSLMGDNGVELDYAEAKDLYRKVTGDKEKRPTAQTHKRVAELGQKNKQSRNPFGMIKDLMFAKTPDDFGDIFSGHNAPSENARRVEESFRDAGRVGGGGQYAPAGQRGRPLPQTMSQIPQQTVNTQGKVTGNVTITVDQQGRVTAPATIQLSGQQKAVNAGAGSAQMNNPQPGDPSYHHAHNALPGG